jgi:5-methyltetrahydrofolate--homocysteine methyltransferase
VLAKTQPVADETAVIERPRAISISTARCSRIRTDLCVPIVPYLDRKKRSVENLTNLWSYINPSMLFGRHLGCKGNFERDVRERLPKALALLERMEDVKREALGFLKVRALWRFFDAERDGNSVHLFEPVAASPLHTFDYHAGSARMDCV